MNPSEEAKIVITTVHKSSGYGYSILIGHLTCVVMTDLAIVANILHLIYARDHV